MYAVRRNDVKTAQEYLRRGASPDTIEESILMPPVLVVAVQKQNIAMVQALLEHGADPWLPGVTSNAIETAVTRPDAAITAMLLEYAAPINDATPIGTYGSFRTPRTAVQTRQYLLRIAVENDQLSQVQVLEENGVAILDVDKSGRWLLIASLRRASWETSAFLIQRGVPSGRGIWLIPQAREVLRQANLVPPPDIPDVTQFRYQPAPMCQDHPFWSASGAIAQMESTQGKRMIRRATLEELSALASLGAHSTILEFYAHCLPVQRGAVMGLMNDFVSIVLDNADFCDDLHRCGYFICGSDMSGDVLAFAPVVRTGHTSSPIVRFSHEIGYEGLGPAEIESHAEVLASDVTEFLEALARTSN